MIAQVTYKSREIQSPPAHATHSTTRRLGHTSTATGSSGRSSVHTHRSAVHTSLYPLQPPETNEQAPSPSYFHSFQARSYSYCNMIFWTILFEFDTVIIPAYFPFVLTLLVTETYEGNIREARFFISSSAVEVLYRGSGVATLPPTSPSRSRKRTRATFERYVCLSIVPW